MQVFPRRRRPACDTPQMPVTRRWKAEAEDGWRRWDDEETALDDCFPDLGVAWLTSSAAAEAEAEGSGFDIEWGGFLTNHLSHGVYALWQLGAPAPLVSRYRALYVARLSRLPAPLPPPPPPASAALLLGQRREYAPLLYLYRGEVRALGVGGALAARLPRLLPGLAGAALHGLIHCGVAARRGQSWLVAEGLAYLHHSYLALPPEAVGGKGVVVGGDGDASSSTAADGSACGLGTVEDALARAGPIPAVASSGRFQRAMAGLYSDAASATRLRAASAELVQRLGLGLGRSGAAEEAALLFDEAARLYAGSRNDYFLLHACTAAWALRQLLPSLQPAAARAAVRDLAAATVATCWVQGYSAAPPPARCPPSAAAAALTPAAALVAAAAVTRALVREGEELRNEHVYKLCAFAAERLEGAGGVGGRRGGGAGRHGVGTVRRAARGNAAGGGAGRLHGAGLGGAPDGSSRSWGSAARHAPT